MRCDALLSRWRFAQSAERVYTLAKDGLAFALPAADVRDFGGVLQRKGYKVFMRGGSIYAFKGLAGKFAPIGVHAAMLLVMAGLPIVVLSDNIISLPTWY